MEEVMEEIPMTEPWGMQEMLWAEAPPMKMAPMAMGWD